MRSSAPPNAMQKNCGPPPVRKAMPSKNHDERSSNAPKNASPIENRSSTNARPASTANKMNCAPKNDACAASNNRSPTVPATSKSANNNSTPSSKNSQR